MSVASGRNHSLALKSDGTVVGWGADNVAQSTPPSGLTGVVSVAAGSFHSLALKNDQTVVGWGQTAIPIGLSNVVAIAAGEYHDLALKNDGTVVAWGENNYGEAMPPTGLRGVMAIGAGGYHSLAVQCDGTVVSWGTNYNHNPRATTVPADLKNVVTIDGGRNHNLAIRKAPRSDPLSFQLAVAPQLNDGNQMLTLKGSTGYCYCVQSSTNLLNWEAIGTVKLTNTLGSNGTGVFVDSTSLPTTKRFYRAVVP